MPDRSAQMREFLVKQGYTQSQPVTDFSTPAYSSFQPDLPAATTPEPENKPHGLFGGLVNGVKNFGVGVVKGTGQVFDNVARPIGNAVSRVLGHSEEAINQ